MMFPHSSSVAMPRSGRHSAKGSDVAGEGFSAGWTEESPAWTTAHI